jgi:hypothetical protein
MRFLIWFLVGAAIWWALIAVHLRVQAYRGRRAVRQSVAAPVTDWRAARRANRLEQEVAWLSEYIQTAVSGDEVLGLRYLRVSLRDGRGQMVQRALPPDVVQKALVALRDAWEREPIVTYRDGEVIVTRKVTIVELDTDSPAAAAQWWDAYYDVERMLPMRKRVETREVARWRR